jgi:hypothetical protein
MSRKILQCEFLGSSVPRAEIDDRARQARLRLERLERSLVPSFERRVRVQTSEQMSPWLLVALGVLVTSSLMIGMLVDAFVEGGFVLPT